MGHSYLPEYTWTRVWSKWLSWYGAEEEGESLVCNLTMRDIKLTVRKGCIGFINKKSEDINQIAY